MDRPVFIPEEYGFFAKFFDGLGNLYYYTIKKNDPYIRVRRYVGVQSYICVDEHNMQNTNDYKSIWWSKTIKHVIEYALSYNITSRDWCVHSKETEESIELEFDIIHNGYKSEIDLDKLSNIVKSPEPNLFYLKKEHSEEGYNLLKSIKLILTEIEKNENRVYVLGENLLIREINGILRFEFD